MKDNVIYFQDYWNQNFQPRKKSLTEGEIMDIKEIRNNFHYSFYDRFWTRLIGLENFNYAVKNYDEEIDYFDVDDILSFWGKAKIWLTTVLTNGFKEKGISLDRDMYASAISIALVSGERVASALEDAINVGSFLAFDGDKQIQLDIPNVYITDHFQVISGNKKARMDKNVVEVNSLADLYRMKREKEKNGSTTLYVLKLENYFLKPVSEYDWADLSTRKDATSVQNNIWAYNEIKKNIDNIFKLIYTFKVAEVIHNKQDNSKKDPVTSVQLVSITDDGKLLVGADINWRITYENSNRGRR